MCMIRSLGTATFFCSFSSASTQWLDLLKILSKLADSKDLPNEEANTTIIYLELTLKCTECFLSQLQPFYYVGTLCHCVPYKKLRL